MSSVAHDHRVTYTMHDWAWTYLNENPRLVITDPERLAPLGVRTATADEKGFIDGRAPWEGEDHREGQPG